MHVFLGYPNKRLKEEIERRHNTETVGGKWKMYDSENNLKTTLVYQENTSCWIDDKNSNLMFGISRLGIGWIYIYENKEMLVTEGSGDVCAKLLKVEDKTTHDTYTLKWFPD